uniref:DUF4235 domain-containing protein n=1 Tax=Panagrellus redivivus TaxID=6233 RepID=A0A7E4V6I2_PANRE
MPKPVSSHGKETRAHYARSVLIKQASLGSFGVVLRRLKERQQRRKTTITFIAGLLLNIAGSTIGWLKAEIDHEMIKVEIRNTLKEYGIARNNTKSEETRSNETATDDKSDEPEENERRLPSIILVLMTTFGRMFNVVGTIKMFQAASAFISLQRRKNLRSTTERLSQGEGDSE